jgi:hypothetical protein
MSKRKGIVISGVVVLGVLWYLFRPELLFVNKTVNESLPAVTSASAGAVAPAPLTSGQFHRGAHETMGTATIYQSGSQRLLRLTNFKTSNGPDVHVYLLGANDATDDATVKEAGFIDLGSIKGNEGDQNYDVPATADLAKYRAITIWCARFNVNFGTAPLHPASATDSTGNAPATVLIGKFQKGAHDTMGTATVYRMADGRQILRLSDFKTSNGPDVHVYLVNASSVAGEDTVKTAGFVDLGSLKGNMGDQNYDIPATADLASHRAVSIWCKRFGVNFGAASLAQP